MGVLKTLGENWQAGKRKYHELGVIAREILSLMDEDIEVSKQTPATPFDALGRDFDIDTAFDMCDLFNDQNAPTISFGNTVLCSYD